MSIESTAWQSDGGEYGYPKEYWEQLPDEVREQIVSAYMVDESDYRLELLVEEQSRFDDATRRAALNRAMAEITEANRRIGLASMSPDHPKYRVIDEKYGVQGAIARGEQFDDNARGELEFACGHCAVEACGLRNNYPAFERKYHTAPKRNRFSKELDKDPSTPC